MEANPIMKTRWGLVNTLFVIIACESWTVLRANTPPNIENIFPQNGAVFDAPGSISIGVRASDAETGLQSVEFFQGDERIGILSISSPSPGIEKTFSTFWTNVPPGEYVLSAKATDLDGASSISSNITVRVVAPTESPIVIVLPFSANTIEADPSQPIQFSIIRSGNREESLNVHYTIAGTAISGLDYEPISDTATIPAGQSVVYVSIFPIWDQILESDESVIVTLNESSFPIPRPVEERYSIGQPNSATLTIEDSPHPPESVSLTVLTQEPIIKGTNVTFRVVINNSETGSVKEVQVLAGRQIVGDIAATAETNEYDFVWTSVPSGRYSLKAYALLQSGATNYSAGTELIVHPGAERPIITISAESNRFRFERTGAVDLPQNVYFSLSGSAESGVDFERIGEMITIPSGDSSTYVYISPLRPANRPETVTVSATLAPLPLNEYGLNLVYGVGIDNTASVSIYHEAIPSDPLNLEIGLLITNIQINVVGPKGFTVVLEGATTLTNWSVMDTNVIGDNATHFTRPISKFHSQEFFRVHYR
jgi:hypothetical protein